MFGVELVAEDVENLEITVAVDDNVASGIDECEVVVRIGIVSVEYKTESRCVIDGLRSERIAGGLQQVDVGTCEIVD